MLDIKMGIFFKDQRGTDAEPSEFKKRTFFFILSSFYRKLQCPRRFKERDPHFVLKIAYPAPFLIVWYLYCIAFPVSSVRTIYLVI
jgi:hypothetical protein